MWCWAAHAASRTARRWSLPDYRSRSWFRILPFTRCARTVVAAEISVEGCLGPSHRTGGGAVGSSAVQQQVERRVRRGAGAVVGVDEDRARVAETQRDVDFAGCRAGTTRADRRDERARRHVPVEDDLVVADTRELVHPRDVIRAAHEDPVTLHDRPERRDRVDVGLETRDLRVEERLECSDLVREIL